jgi:flagellum-specific peptidoglycan hydrolase FlgJ
MYKLNPTSLTFEKVNMFKHRFKLATYTIGLSLIVSLATHFWTKSHIVESLTEYEKVLLVQEANKFSQEKFVLKLKELNFKYPHIVMAQAMLETGSFKSVVFKQNNNLFGMKEATSRLNLCKGTEHGHASYSTWEDSVLDYALWCTSYANKANSESEYFQILNSLGYAEDGSYVVKLKEMIEKHNLKEKFK